MLYNFFQVREICEVINAGTQPMQNSCVMNKHSEIQEERVAWSQFWVNKGLIAVEVLVIFYIENLIRKVDLHFISTSKTSEEKPHINFFLKSQNCRT